jgi:GT2 family glycosyltransferase
MSNLRSTCTVVITTHNRCSELRETLQQLRVLDPRPDAVLVCLDQCTDHSRSMLEREFPECAILENEVKLGSVPSRDRAFRLAKTDLIVSLDDDSYPIQKNFMNAISDLAQRHPEAGAFTVAEVRNDDLAGSGKGPHASGRYVPAFPNCAGIYRRELYGTIAEFPSFFCHAYEEPDYCLQLYAAGLGVWFEPSLSVRHRFSMRERNMLLRHRQNARNEFWSVIMRCPFPYVFAVALYRLIRQFQHAFGQGLRWWTREPLWWVEALAGIPECVRRRRAVSWKRYYGWMRLARKPRSEAIRL